MTSLMQQYTTIKAKYPAAIVLFRVGDFYETFNKDAEIASRILGVTLVKTLASEDIKATASIFHHAVDDAMCKLVKAGHQVALCDQLEAPKPGPMLRGVTEVIEPHRA